MMTPDQIAQAAKTAGGSMVDYRNHLPGGRLQLSFLDERAVVAFAQAVNALHAPAAGADFEAVYSRALKESQPGTIKDIARLCFESRPIAPTAEADPPNPWRLPLPRMPDVRPAPPGRLPSKDHPMKQAYIEKNFRSETRALIATINAVIADFQSQGYMLSLRQLYYQLVAAGLIENTEKSYKNTGNVVNDARLAGLMDWDAIEDRGREVVKRSAWTSGQSILDGAAAGFHMDLWVNQPTRVYCIVEKQALEGVLQDVCHTNDVPLLAARGYPSVSIVREMCENFLLQDAANHDQDILILHLGDHDPSGLDMTRDLRERIELFMGDDSHRVIIERLALNMPQVRRFKPPPNPAKITDSRFEGYRKQHGSESWELDAMKPQFLNDLVTAAIDNVRYPDLWEERVAEVEAVRTKLQRVAKNFKG